MISARARTTSTVTPAASGGPRPRLRLADAGLACLSAVLLLLSFPRFDLGVLAWVALVPLLVAVDGKRPWQAFCLAWLTGAIFFNGLFYWIWTIRAFNSWDGLIILSTYLPLYLSLWALAVVWVRKRTGLPAAVVAPPLLVAGEYLRAHASFLSMPWMFLGHSQYAYPALIQISALTGAYGVSFLIALVNAAIADALTAARRPSADGPGARRGWPSPRASLAAAGLLAGATALYGVVVLSDGSGLERLRIGLIQGNVPQDLKWNDPVRRTILDRYAVLTREVARTGPALIVWPESAVPGDVQHHTELRQRVAQLAVETGTPLLVGSSEFAKFTDRRLRGKYYNTLVLFSPQGRIEGTYRKMALVPFGEYVPLRDYLTWPKAIVSEMGDYLPGTEYTAFDIGPVRFRSVICWEIIFPDLVRESVRRGAAFLVLATNEAWFGDTAAPYELLAMTVLRAAENRVAIARSANTGVSAFIDPFGRITRRLRGAGDRDLFVEGVLVDSIPLAGQATFYTRYGDVFAFFIIAASAGLVFLAAWPRRARRPAVPSEGPVAETSGRSSTCVEA